VEDERSFVWPDVWTPAIPEIARRVKAFCAAAGVQAWDADDVLQLVLIRVHRATFLPRPGEERIRPFASIDKLAAWARAVARSVLAEMREKAERRRLSQEVDPTGLAATNTKDPDLEPLSEYLGLLTDPVEREVVRLYFEEALTQEQIAERLGRWKSKSKVNGVLHSAINKLRRRFGA
jgi:RNA polymerase sigma factor (sigma-70 family)